MNTLERLRLRTEASTLTRRIGVVRQITGLAIEASGPDVMVGEMCTILARDQAPMRAEVVGLRPGVVTLMPYAASHGLAVGCEVIASGESAGIGVGDELLGRVIDGFGVPLDDGPAPPTTRRRSLKSAPLNPMRRSRIDKVLETGIRCIDAFTTLGQGQRVGIFSGSGVGKSTLLGQIARHARADVNVIALIGERGREVREFIDRQLGPKGLARSVVVVATSDQPAVARLRAAYAALSIAEHFRDEGRQVLLTMDSITRFAMARREVGLSAGEPPTARGYTPSVFAELPELCERCGTSDSGGSISALLTVLVEGDDLNEPIADSLRATLDGHIVLSRRLAQQAHFPAIDVLHSASRVMSEVASEDARALASDAVSMLALIEQYRQMVDIGAYTAGANPALDRALAARSSLTAFLRQSESGVRRDAALAELAALMRTSQ